jgi:peptide/nickel transport system substrate-binding protein
MIRRVLALLVLALATQLAANAGAAPRKDNAVIGMTLEPPGLDPTTGAAAAIGEIVHLNLFEGLTRINDDGSVSPLLAERWTISADLKTYTFKLRHGVKFHNGEALDSGKVKFSFERAAANDSTNKDKPVFRNIRAIDTPAPDTVVLHLEQGNPDMLFLLGQNTAVIVEPKSVATNATQPVGTGPFRFESWNKGASATLARWDGFRDPKATRLARLTFRFITDPAAQVAALMAGDVDAFPRVAASQAAEQLRADGRFAVWATGTKGKTILAMNNKHKPLDDVRVRRAISMALDRKALIDGAADGLGTPIGSHMVPGDYGYVDLTAANPFDVNRAQALLKEAGVRTPVELTLKLPPPGYARQGGEIIAAQLARIGITARIENVEWAQWLSDVYKNKNYDLTVISHVEPLDLIRYTESDYYWQYDSQAFRDIMQRVNGTPNGPARLKALSEAQRQLANDAVNAWLFQLAPLSVADKHLKGLWKNSPIFVNDMTAAYWE